MRVTFPYSTWWCAGEPAVVLGGKASNRGHCSLRVLPERLSCEDVPQLIEITVTAIAFRRKKIYNQKKEEYEAFWSVFFRIVSWQ